MHRGPLTDHISNLNPVFGEQLQAMTQRLIDHGANPTQAGATAMAMIDRMVNNQAEMMAVNDISWVMGLMILALAPLILLLPGRARTTQARAKAGLAR